MKKYIVISGILSLVLAGVTFAAGIPKHENADRALTQFTERKNREVEHIDRMIAHIEDRLDRASKDATSRHAQTFSFRGLSLQDTTSLIDKINAIKIKIAADTTPEALQADRQALRELISPNQPQQ